MAMARNYFQENIEQLDIRFGALVHRLKTIDEDDSFHIVKAKNGSFTVKVDCELGYTKFLHSSYNPIYEGDVLNQQRYHADANLFIIMGLGLGYHVISLLKRLQPEQKLLIIEPHPPLFKKALTIMDMREVFNDTRVFIIVEAYLISIKQKIKAYLNDFIPYNSTTIKFEFISLYERWDRYRTFLIEVKTLINTSFTDISALKACVINQIDYLRTSGLGKKFLGTYKDCINFFRERIKKGHSLNDAEIGMLITYYLFSHESYAETFERGSRCEV